MAAAGRRQLDMPGTSRSTPLSRDDDTDDVSPYPTPAPTTPTASSLASLTPSRGRVSNRYPDTLGRVPLHRRGKSKTYERLEDLLREAGYKETRVFTPEADPHARSTVDKRDGNSVRGSVGAVVDFFAGLVSRGSSVARETAPMEEEGVPSDLHAWSPPSPLVHAGHIRDSKAKRVPSRADLSSLHGSSENVRHRSYVDLSADASQRNHAHQVVSIHQSSQGQPHSYLKVHHPHRHIHSRHPVHNDTSKSASTKPNPPNARAYLRHMASAPNIQPLAKRASLSEVSLRSHAVRRDPRKSPRRTFVLNDEESIAESDHEPPSRVDESEQQVHPPLPRNWMESVAKALLSGVGGPAAVSSDAASTRTVETESTQKSSTLSDKSGRGRTLTQGTKPPLLCVQVKAKTSEGQVSCTRVMCRSAPTSRANSRVRSGNHRTKRSGGQRKERDKPRNRRKGKERGTDVVPSLARTKAENDGWMAPRQRYLNGWGVEGEEQAGAEGVWSDESGDEDEEEDDEDEDGELGLDRLLVPARRQHSIQSLRKHLQLPPSQLFRGRPRSPRSGGRVSPFGGTPTGRLDWGDASWGRSRVREWTTSQGEEGEDGYSHVFASEVGSGRTGTRWRRGLPSLTQWTTTS